MNPSEPSDDDFKLEPSYTYRAKLLRTIDGDTVDLEIDVGFHLKATVRCRLYGVDTPELADKDPRIHVCALIAKDFTAKTLDGQALLAKTLKTDSFGRWLVLIWFNDRVGKQVFFNSMLTTQGFAKVYRDTLKLLGDEKP